MTLDVFDAWMTLAGVGVMNVPHAVCLIYSIRAGGCMRRARELGRQGAEGRIPAGNTWLAVAMMTALASRARVSHLRAARVAGFAVWGGLFTGAARVTGQANNGEWVTAALWLLMYLYLGLMCMILRGIHLRMAGRAEEIAGEIEKQVFFGRGVS